ncbi:hypothetical protein WR25_18103 [Diploscapter pachys]|uniref:G protein-coupled receptor n=1 Tax=Diploscapter pachys TaxID=2018661 RepID=A0A2A2LJQ4_9BILA|nr:hypothetical protein WR25_18103 [Diploscapter pachys]
MGNYKYVVLAFVCFDILYSLVDVITKPCVTFTLMVYWGYKSQKALSKFDTMLSSSTRALQKSLLKALVIQAMVPLFFAYIPCWICYSLPLMPFEISKYHYFMLLVITLIMLFPICDCIVIIYYVKAFRDTLIEILGNIPYLNCWIAQIRSDSRNLTNQNNVLGESGRLVARFANLVSAAGHALEHTGLVADIAGRAFPAARLRLEPLSESLGLLLLLLDELLLELRLLSRRLDRSGSRLEHAGKLNMI